MTDDDKRLYLEWVSSLMESAERKMAASNNAKSDDKYFDFTTELAYYTYDTALSQIDKTPESTKLSFLTDVIRLGNEYWELACAYIHQQVNVPITKTGFILIMESITQNIDHAELTDAQDDVNKLLHDSIVAVAIEKGGSLWEPIGEDTPKYKKLTDEQIKNILNNSNTNLIKEFFETFKNIGTFHQDPTLYETDDQRELHKKMLAIYQTLTDTETK